jgi:hypothetical protein
VIDALRRWWRQLWPSPDPAGPEPPAVSGRSGGSDGGVIEETAPAREPGRRRYTVPPRDDDPERETRLGTVLQALAGGSLTRGELAARVGAGEWGPGRLDAVVAHGVASGVLLVEESDGVGANGAGTSEDGDVVRARYAD